MTMTDHHDEPLWVGMDVDAELAGRAEEDLRRTDSVPADAQEPRRPRAARALRVALAHIGRDAVPRFPLQA